MNKKILIVEDDKDINFIYEDILGEKYDTVYAESAEEARTELKKQEFDLMILDIVLPGKAGDAFFKEMKKDPKFSDLKIIVVSILNDAMGQLDKIDQDITCVQKPFNEIKLLSTIKEKLKE